MDCSCNDFKMIKDEELDYYIGGYVNLCKNSKESISCNLTESLYRFKIYQTSNSVYSKVLLYELDENARAKEPQRYLNEIEYNYIVCLKGHIVLTRDQFRDLIFLEKDGESVYQYLKIIGFEEDENFKKL